MGSRDFVIEDGVFVSCPMEYEGRVVVPEGVADIGERAFLYCSGVTEVVLPQSLHGIGIAAFHGCGIYDIKIPKSMSYIADCAFLCCENLQEIELPDGLTVVCEGLLCGCSNLRKVTIPQSVKIIRETAFACCPKLEDVELSPNIERF